MYKYLVSRTVDPIVAVAFGVSAYYLYERRQQKPEELRLNSLIKKWAKSE